MIELISNILQLTVTLGCCLGAIIAYIRTRRQAYFPLVCFYGCFALAGLYWTLYLLLFERTPEIVSVSYIGWNTSLIFLYILQDTLAAQEPKTRWCLLAPAVGLPMVGVIIYFDYGLSRIIACALLIVIAWRAIRGLVGGAKVMRAMHIALLLYAAAEMGLWTVACFFSGSHWKDPYIWMDFLLTISLFVIFPASRKAVEA